jgi:NADH-quinone oxidoreductase subunit L
MIMENIVTQWMWPSWLCWILPLAGALVTPILAKISHKVRNYGAILFSFSAVVMTVLMIPYLFEGTIIHNQVSWISLPDAPILETLKAGTLVDPLSIIVANVVSIIAFLIMVYSLGYMHDDPNQTRYWFFMNLFIGNMLLLIMSDNLLQTLFGWEGVGVCSYGLIGFWYQDSKKDWLKCWVGEGKEAYPPSHSSLKAFLVTRLGDIFLLIGAFVILVFSGTLNYLDLQNGAINLVPTWALIPAALLLLGGPIGKSAQLPLGEWLPDAMTGPTPASALIHAATMVKAGVYLVGRLFPIFYLVAWHEGIVGLTSFFYTIAWIGGITAFIAGTQAITATELKKVLAYSTLSQLGYMMMALGVAGTNPNPTIMLIAYTGAIFHLLSHALFKAALFLSAGAVIHASESRFMYHMGGIKADMPKTFWIMSMAAFSLMGFPFIFSGFWSKDMILEGVLVAEQYGLLILGLVTAAMTCFYTLRMISLTFLGKKSEHLTELEHHGHHVHDPPLVMLVPYLILTIATISLGLVGSFAKGSLEHIFEVNFEGIIHSVHVATLVSEEAIKSAESLTIAASVIMLIIGAIPAYFLYIKRSRDPAKLVESSNVLKSLWTLLFNRYYLNRLYYVLIVNPVIKGSAWLSKNLETGIIDRFNYVLADFVNKSSAWLLTNLELNVIDKFNYVFAAAVRAFSNSFRRTHTGVLTYNVIGIVLGAVIILLLFMLIIIQSGGTII